MNTDIMTIAKTLQEYKWFHGMAIRDNVIHVYILNKLDVNSAIAAKDLISSYGYDKDKIKIIQVRGGENKNS